MACHVLVVQRLLYVVNGLLQPDWGHEQDARFSLPRQLAALLPLLALDIRLLVHSLGLVLDLLPVVSK